MTMKVLKNKVIILIMLLILLSDNLAANEQNDALMLSTVGQKLSINNAQAFQDKITALESALHDVKNIQVESMDDSYPDSHQQTIHEINRSTHLDSYDLVVADISGLGDSPKFSHEFVTFGHVNYVFIGPGSIKVSYEDDEEVKVFEQGVHLFSIQDDATVTWQDGQLYLDALKGVGLVHSSMVNHWLYVPKDAMNEITVIMNDEFSILKLKQENNFSKELIKPDLQGSVLNMENYVKSGLFSSGNINRYISPYSDKMLMPKGLAIANGLFFKDVTSDQWSNQQLLDEHLNASMLSLAKIKKALQNTK